MNVDINDQGDDFMMECLLKENLIHNLTIDL